jgi:hypothetical protein
MRKQVDFSNKTTFTVQRVFHDTMEIGGRLDFPVTSLPRGKEYRYPWVGDWVGSKIGLDAVAMRIIMPFKEPKPGCSVRITTTATTIFAVYFTTLSVANL